MYLKTRFTAYLSAICLFMKVFRVCTVILNILSRKTGHILRKNGQ